MGELELWGHEFSPPITIPQFEKVMEKAAETLKLRLRFIPRKNGDICGELTDKFTNLEFTTIKEKGKIAAVNLNPYDVSWTTPYTKAIIATYEELYGKSSS